VILTFFKEGIGNILTMPYAYFLGVFLESYWGLGTCGTGTGNIGSIGNTGNTGNTGNNGRVPWVLNLIVYHSKTPWS